MKSQRSMVEPLRGQRRCAERAPARLPRAEKRKRWLRLSAGLLWAPDIPLGEAASDDDGNEQKK
jgi:hypothetical protein